MNDDLIPPPAEGPENLKMCSKVHTRERAALLLHTRMIYDTIL